MTSLLENPVFRHGMSISSAAMLVVIAFFFLEGLTRWVTLAIAVLEITVVPQVLKRVAAQGAAA